MFKTDQKRIEYLHQIKNEKPIQSLDDIVEMLIYYNNEINITDAYKIAVQKQRNQILDEYLRNIEISLRELVHLKD